MRLACNSLFVYITIHFLKSTVLISMHIACKRVHACMCHAQVQKKIPGGRGRGPKNNFVFGGLVIEISLQCM